MTVVDCCRVTVVIDRSDSAAVDLAVPGRMNVGELMPWIVDLVGAQAIPERVGFADRWTLSRVGGCALEEPMTLPGNGVRDGEVLILTVDPPPATSDITDLSQHVVDAAAPTAADRRMQRRLGMCTWWWSVVLGATALVWPNSISRDDRAITAMVVALVATVASIMASRVNLETIATVSFGLAAIVFGAVGGFLIVPGGPAPANSLLAAAICFAVSSVLLRLTGRGLAVYTATTAASTIAAIIVAAATIWTMPMASVGVWLAAMSVAMQGLAARVAVALAGLSPKMPGSGDDAVLPSDQAIERAARGHLVLTGLGAGLSMSAALGAVLVIADPHGSGEWRRLVFVGIVATALTFRACQQRGAVRSASALLAVLITTAAAFTRFVTAAPGYASAMCVIAVGIGAGTVWLTHADVGSHVSPLARRGVEYCEYLAIATVVPMACWVSGVFGAVRGLSLS